MNELAQYLKEVRRIHRWFTPEEELVLAARKDRGDTEARDLLVVSCLPMVISYAKRYAQSDHEMQDLIQAGNIGLLRGAGEFDLRRGIPFASYAFLWIRQGIFYALKKDSRYWKVGSFEDIIETSDGAFQLKDLLAAPCGPSLVEEKEYYDHCCRYVESLLEEISYRRAYVLRLRLSRGAESTSRAIGRILKVGTTRALQLVVSAEKWMLKHHWEHRRTVDLQGLEWGISPQLLGDRRFLAMLRVIKLDNQGRKWPVPDKWSKEESGLSEELLKNLRKKLLQQRGSRVV